MRKVGFLGTGFTMKNGFYIEELKEYEIDSIIPKSNEIEIIHDIIMTELSKGIINEMSKKIMLEIMERMVKEDEIEGVILGCTEFQILVKQEDTNIVLFDTTEIHVNYIVDYALKDNL